MNHPTLMKTALTTLALLGAALVALAPGCETMTTTRKLQLSEEARQKLEEEKQVVVSRMDEEQRRASEARERARGLREAQSHAEAARHQDALRILEELLHPPPVVRQDADGKEVVEPQEDKRAPLDPEEEARLLSVRAFVLSRLEREAEAVQGFRAALEKDPRLGEARRNLGTLHFNARRYQEALQAWEPELAEGSRDADLLFQVAQARYEVGKSRGSLADLEAARQAILDVLLQRPSDAEAGRWLAVLDLETGRHGEAARRLEALRRESPLDPDYLELLGNAYLGAGEREKALGCLELASRVRLPDPAGMRLLGDLYRLEGFAGRAADWLLRAHGNDPRQAPPAERLVAGRLLLEAARAEEATAWLGAIPEGVEEHAEGQALLARAYLAQGQAEPALAAYENVKRARPQDGPAHVALGRLYLERGELRPAEEAFARASALPGTEAEGFAGLAEASYKKGDLEAALRSYRRAQDAAADGRYLLVLRKLEEELRLRKQG